MHNRNKKKNCNGQRYFPKMKPILANRNISMGTKLKVMKTYVWAVLLYGCECWTMNSEVVKKLEATEMWFIRRMLRISWMEKRSNESVLKEANLERTLLKTIRQRQLQFLGHIYRNRGLEHLAITGKIEGKRSRGRQRVTFVNSIDTWSLSGRYANSQTL